MHEWSFVPVVLCFMQLYIVDTSLASGTQNSSQCTFKCTEGGGSAICWKNIMDHFTDGLQMALRDYVSAVGHASHWQHQHNRDSTVDIVAESLQGRLSDDGPLNRSELIAIFKAILNMTSVNQLRQPDVDLPSLLCPTPCDYYPKMWASLFFITFTAFSLSCLAFVVHLCRSERLRGAVKRDGLVYRPA